MSVSAQLRAHAAAILVCDEREPLLSFELPLRLEPEANRHTHWRDRQQRAKAQRNYALLECRAWMRLARGRTQAFLPCVVRIVRVAPRALDSDGAVSSAKHVRDGIADALGIDDRDGRVVWVVDQERGKPKTHAVRIEVYAR